jgi:hypothetical protein
MSTLLGPLPTESNDVPPSASVNLAEVSNALALHRPLEGADAPPAVAPKAKEPVPLRSIFGTPQHPVASIVLESAKAHPEAFLYSGTSVGSRPCTAASAPCIVAEGEEGFADAAERAKLEYFDIFQALMLPSLTARMTPEGLRRFRQLIVRGGPQLIALLLHASRQLLKDPSQVDTFLTLITDIHAGWCAAVVTQQAPEEPLRSAAQALPGPPPPVAAASLPPMPMQAEDPALSLMPIVPPMSFEPPNLVPRRVAIPPQYRRVGSGTTHRLGGPARYVSLAGQTISPGIRVSIPNSAKRSNQPTEGSEDSRPQSANSVDDGGAFVESRPSVRRSLRAPKRRRPNPDEDEEDLGASEEQMSGLESLVHAIPASAQPPSLPAGPMQSWDSVVSER